MKNYEFLFLRSRGVTGMLPAKAPRKLGRISETIVLRYWITGSAVGLSSLRKGK